ncbi:beta-galactosidase [Antribacter gilvus]|uniref:beta-galactosidase n=1 Tax=Antribacter gilvus TaxID=2304675 RepID=UPI000F778BA7|nr:beta-galactosidase [Antribacter gilvus]
MAPDAALTHAARTVRVVPPEPERRGHLAVGDPQGATSRIEVTSRWLERDGRPWFPVTGEIHYSRIPRERWSEVLGHAASGGLTSVATYVFWQAHEPEPGDFRWDDNLDLRAFVELAAHHGLDVVARIGPWAHGEARHGGFPGWLVESGLPTRTNDPAYLERVRLLYGRIAAQLAGLTHADGGPVVGVQMDNELYDQPQHLATLREIAEELGLRVPVWTATGWGGAQVPETLLPVYSAYAEGFWEESDTEWAPFAAFHFRYSAVRDDLTVGADLREALDGIVLDPGAVPLKDDSAVPFAMCELGGGMHVAYHRRPLVTGQDVDGVGLAKIGSGSVWQGYYMYAGGTQRVGPTGPEQESHATGYPNDVPTLTYDFNAPVGEHGQVRPHHHLLRRRHLWLHAEGHRLATMAPQVGGGSEDPEELRWAIRSDGRSGYLFLTTYQPAQRPLPPQEGVQVTVAFDDGDVTVPTQAVDLPAGLTTVWPLRYELADGLVLRSATAEVVTRLTDQSGEIVVLAAADGVPVELVVEGQVPVGGSGRTAAGSDDGATVVRLAAEPGPACVVELRGVRVLVLDAASANRLYRLDVAGRERLVLSDAPVYAEDGGLVLHTSEPVCTVALLPAPATLTADGAPVPGGAQDGPWRRWTLPVPAAGTRTLVSGLAPVAAAPPEPVRGGPMDRLSAPTDFSGAAAVVVDVPAEALAGVDRTLLRVRWTGDVGRAFVGERLVGDHFWHGRDWDVDLTPHAAAVAQHGVRLELLPWRAATGVWVDPTVRPVSDGLTVESVDVVRVARVRLEATEG